MAAPAEALRPLPPQHQGEAGKCRQRADSRLGHGLVAGLDANPLRHATFFNHFDRHTDRFGGAGRLAPGLERRLLDRHRIRLFRSTQRPCREGWQCEQHATEQKPDFEDPQHGGGTGC